MLVVVRLEREGESITDDDKRNGRPGKGGGQRQGV